MDKLPKNFWLYLASAVLVALIILVIFFITKSPETAPLPTPQPTSVEPPVALPSPNPQPTAPPAPLAPTAPPAPQPVVVPAPKGEAIAGFPKELILDKAAKVVTSNSVKYPDGRTQYSAKLSSDKSMNDLFDAYRSYFNSNGWLIAKTATSTDSLSIIARKGDASGITVDILATAKGSDLLLNYLAK